MKQTLGNFLAQANKDFPVDCELFAALQGNQAMLSIIGNIAGDKTILRGCELEANNTRRKEGYLFIRTVDFSQGEVLYFEGGAVQGGMYVKQEAEVVTSLGITYPHAYTVRSLVAGAGTENYSWDDFHTLKSTQALEAYNKEQDKQIALLQPTPVGIVQMWAGGVAGGKLPLNYLLCDGARLVVSQYPELYAAIGRIHTASSVPSGYFCLPDLRSRFVVGYNYNDGDYDTLGKVGGEKKHRLLTSEMPSHSHGQYLWSPASGGWRGGGNDSWPDATSHHDRTTPFGNTASAGGGAEHENRPPYYTLAFIIKIK